MIIELNSYVKGWFLTILFFFVLFIGQAQSIRFSEFYDSDLGAGALLNIVQLDSSFVAQGVNLKNGVRQSHTVKTDLQGNLISEHIVSDINVGYSSIALAQMENGQLASAGHICDYNTPSPGYCDYYFARLDETGDTLFTKVYERKDTCDVLLDMVQTRPNKIMLIGWTCNDTTESDAELMLLTVDTLGNELNRVIWGVSSNDYVHSGTVIDSNGETLLTGWTGSNTWVIKTDSIGNVLWHQVYGQLSSGGDGGTEVLKLPDGNFAIVGGSENGSTGNSDGFILKVDPNGNEIWTKKYVATTGTQSLWAGVALDDGSILSCGQTTNTNDGSQAGWLIKTDENGDTLWTRTFNSSSFIDLFRNMIVLPNGDIVMVGFGDGENSITQDGWILRVDSMGCLLEGCHAVGVNDELSMNNYELEVYPNPAAGQVKVNARQNHINKINLTNVFGQHLNTYAIKRSQQIELDLSGYQNGIYLVEVELEDGRRSMQRLVVQR